MAGLADLAPATETVSGVVVKGVSARGVAQLLSAFPQLRMMFSAGTKPGFEDLLKIAPDAIAQIIAAGLGKAGDPETIEQADGLAIDTQADLLAAVLRCTMPKGVGPFMEKLQSFEGILKVDGAAASPGAPATKSPKPSST